ALALWRSGALALWRSGALAPGHSGAPAPLWRSGALALWRLGTPAHPRPSGALALWRSGALALWRSGALALWDDGAMEHAVSLATLTPPIALGPLDGRYRKAVAPLVDHLSEAALNRARLHVEVEWLIHLTGEQVLPGAPELSAEDIA